MLKPLLLLLCAACVPAQDYLAFTRNDDNATTAQTLIIPVAADGTFTYTSPFYESRIAADAATASSHARVGYVIEGTVQVLKDGARSIAFSVTHTQVTAWTLPNPTRGYQPDINSTIVKTTIINRPGEESPLDSLIYEAINGKKQRSHGTLVLLSEDEFKRW